MTDSGDNIIEFPQGLPEPSADELDALNKQTLESLGFAFGIHEFWPVGVEFIAPTTEELQLANFVASWATDSLEFTSTAPPPTEWEATAEKRLRKLRTERANACGYTGFLGFIDSTEG